MSAASAGELGSWQACGLLDGSRCGVGGPFGASFYLGKECRKGSDGSQGVRSRHDITHLSVRAREGAGSDGGGARAEGHPGREIHNVAEGVQDHEMERVRPPVMIKVKRGQRTESVEKGILDMTRWSQCRITAIDLSNARIGAEGAGRLECV